MANVLEQINQYRPRTNNPTSRWLAVGTPKWALDYGFDTMDSTFQHREWLRRWVELPPVTLGVILEGPVGTGKTGLMCAALRECAAREFGSPGYWSLVTGPIFVQSVRNKQAPVTEAPVWFERWMDMRDRILGKYDLEFPDTYRCKQDILADLDEHVEVLGVDDLDTDKFSHTKEEILLHLVERPSSGKRIIATTNTPRAEWGECFGERVMDRLSDSRYFSILQVTGSSRRHR